MISVVHEVGLRSVAQRSDLTLGVVVADIAIVLLVGTLLGRLGRFVKQPPVVGEVLAGILLGPSLLGLLPGHLPNRIFPAEVRPYLSAVSQVGLLIFMFGVGWEFDKRLLSGRRRAALTVSMTSIALAFALGVGLATALYQAHSTVNGHHISFAAFALFMGAAMSITGFPVLARILAEHRMLGTPVGALALAGAAIDDVLAWCILALVAAIVTASGPGDLLQIFILSAAYIALLALVVRPLLARLVRRWTGVRVAPSLMIVIISGLFFSAYATTWIGIHAIFGAFAFGFVMPREDVATLRETLTRSIENISVVLLPVFFVVTGLNVDMGAIGSRGWLELGAILFLACLGKMVGAIGPAKLFGMSWRDSTSLGLLMNTRGLTELIILNTGAALGVLDGRMFTMMVLMALITTAMAGPLLPTAPLPTPSDFTAPLGLAETGSRP